MEALEDHACIHTTIYARIFWIVSEFMCFRAGTSRWRHWRTCSNSATPVSLTAVYIHTYIRTQHQHAHKSMIVVLSQADTCKSSYRYACMHAHTRTHVKLDLCIWKRYSRKPTHARAFYMHARTHARTRMKLDVHSFDWAVLASQHVQEQLQALMHAHVRAHT